MGETNGKLKKFKGSCSNRKCRRKRMKNRNKKLTEKFKKKKRGKCEVAWRQVHEVNKVINSSHNNSEITINPVFEHY